MPDPIPVPIPCAAQVAPRAAPNPWQVLVLVATGALVVPMDASIVSVALPVLGPRLHLTYSMSLWIQMAYLLSMATLLLPLAKLADERGRFRFYLGGMAVFTLGSLAAAASQDGITLILSRVIQGAGGAAISSTAAALLTATFPPRQRGWALGVGMMAAYAGFTLGPPLGGWLVDALGWRWIFLVNLPIGAAVLAWGSWIPGEEPAPEESSAGFDGAGAVWLGMTLICWLVPLTFSTDWGWHALRPWCLLGMAVVAGLGFCATELRARNPLFDIRALRGNRTFLLSNLAALLANCAFYATSVLTAMVLQLVHHMPAHAVGGLLLCQPLIQALLSPLFGHLGDRIGARFLGAAGMVVTALALVGLAAGSGHPAAIAGALGILGLGMSAFAAPNTSSVMGSVDLRHLGTASAFQACMRVLGQGLSLAVLGGVAAWRLSPEAWRQLLQGRSTAAMAGFAQGYRMAMGTGALIALAAAWASLARGPFVPASHRAQARARG